MAESTALEALTAELLGDVGVLHDQVKALRDVLPNVVQELSSRLELQTGNMLGAAEKLNDVLRATARQIDTNTQAALSKALDAAKADISSTATLVAGAAVREAVGDEVRQAVGRINDAATQLAQVAATASRQVAWGWGKGAALMFTASALGGLVVFATLQFSGLINVKLSEAERRAMANGQLLGRIWDRLTPKERDRINDLAKANP